MVTVRKKLNKTQTLQRGKWEELQCSKVFNTEPRIRVYFLACEKTNWFSFIIMVDVKRPNSENKTQLSASVKENHLRSTDWGPFTQKAFCSVWTAPKSALMNILTLNSACVLSMRLGVSNMPNLRSSVDLIWKRGHIIEVSNSCVRIPVFPGVQ